MTEQAIKELFESQEYPKTEFQYDTDELIYYDGSRDMMYAFRYTEEQEWHQVFAFNNCMDRWVEIIHPEEKNVVTQFLTQIRNGESSSEMKCRFLEKERYVWSQVKLYTLGGDYHIKRKIALGYRRNLFLSGYYQVDNYSSQLDSTTMIYTEKNWKDALERVLSKYAIQSGILCIMDINQFHVINDKFGYRVADQLLLHIVENIREVFCGAAMIGRLDADLFGIYVNDVISPVNWMDKFQRVFYLTKQNYCQSPVADYLSFSAGTACYPQDANCYQELYDKAREAWVYSKMSKQERVERYKEHMLRSVWDKYLGEEWKQMSTFDDLTKLYHIDAFREKTRELMEQQHERKYVIVYADISNFKYMNASFGYETGDQILKNWGRIIRDEISSIIIAGRESEDRMVWLREINPECTEEEIADELNEEKRYTETQMKSLFPGSNFTLNMGAYCLKDGEDDVGAAIANANMARKKARNSTMRCELYTEQMKKDQDEATLMVASLDEALRNHEFAVYLQPKVACGSGKIIGAEALVRWERHGKQVIYPDRFISIFEKYGCIEKVDYSVYEQVFALLKKWLREGREAIPISVNVSRVHLKGTGLIAKIEELMERYQIPSSLVEFEITESMYQESLPGLEPVMKYLKDRGFKVSMDDFGADSSNLYALSTIPVDVVKMDKVFLRRGTLSEQDKIIISSVVDMTNKLQKQILCEGVETEEQKTFLTSVGCHAWQGYLCSKPVPIVEFERKFIQPSSPQ